MALTTADDHVPGRPVAASPEHHHLGKHARGDHQQTPSPRPRARTATPATSVDPHAPTIHLPCLAPRGRRARLRQSTSQRWASGGTTALGETGGVFLYWASPSWQAGAGESQKIIAHELFHVFQNQLDKLGARNEVTPSNQVRASGPVWLEEGSAEMIGYRVASDRGLLSYSTVLARQIASARQVGQPLRAVQTYDQFNAIPNPYSFGHVAADHLVGVAPGGVPALTAYYNALGSGNDWPTAFQSAFGLSADAYDTNFDAYRSKL